MHRFNKRPGEPLVANIIDDPLSNEHAILIGGDLPDVVYLPNDPTFLPDCGREVKVIRAFTGICPKTKTVCRHLELDYQLPSRPGKNLCVAESPAAGQFFWYTAKEPQPEQEPT